VCVYVHRTQLHTATRCNTLPRTLQQRTAPTNLKFALRSCLSEYHVCIYIYIGLSNTLQHTATHVATENCPVIKPREISSWRSIVVFSYLRCIHSISLQHAATRCNTLQHTLQQKTLKSSPKRSQVRALHSCLFIYHAYVFIGLF